MEQQLNKFKRKLAKNKLTDGDLFDYHLLTTHGFPEKVSAIAQDPFLNILALGTKTGLVKVYGASGLQLEASLDAQREVESLVFVPNQGRVVGVSKQNNESFLTLFETSAVSGTESLKQALELKFDGKVASTLSLSPDSAKLLVGTEDGDVLLVDTKSLSLDDSAIHLDVAMQNVPDDLKLNPGSVKSVKFHPLDSNLVLIAYRKGLLVLWNLEDKIARGTFYTSCEGLETVSWADDGSKFITAHEDGTFFDWQVDEAKDFAHPKQCFPFGNDEQSYPISKLEVFKGIDGENEIVAFAGGLPKESYPDTNSLSIKKGNNSEYTTFQVSGKIIDFLMVKEVEESAVEVNEEGEKLDEEKAEDGEAAAQDNEDAENDKSDEWIEVAKKVSYKPSMLLILTQYELIALDLQSDEENEDEKIPSYPVIKKPYLNSASPNDTTCVYAFEDCEQSFIDQLAALGKESQVGLSKREWPINGGKLIGDSSEKKNVLAVGHYDGSVRFYDVNSGKFELLHTVTIGVHFKPIDLDEEFSYDRILGGVKLRKVGDDFEASADDSRFAVCKMYICPVSNDLFVGTHSGQVIVFKLESTNIEEIKSYELKIVPDEAGFKWKGCHPAVPKDEELETLPVGYTISYVVQCEPPAPVTAMSVNTPTGLIAIGTSHGFGVFDSKAMKCVFTRSALVENDEAASGHKLSKTKSLRESIRNSFRRVKPKKAAEPAASSSATPQVEEAKPEQQSEPAAAESKDEPKVEESNNVEASVEVENKADDEKKVEEEVADAEEKKEDEQVEQTVETVTTVVKEEEENGESVRVESSVTVTTTTVVTEDLAKTDEEKLKEKESSPSPAPAVSIQEPEDARHVGRVVEARGESQDKTMQSTIRYLVFADTFLRNSRENTQSLWVGSHAGSVYSYIIELPEDREAGEANLTIAKEIKLHHRAPIVFMCILDHSGFPLPDPAAVAANKASGPDMAGHHYLVVCSEEQVKLFTLPQLKARYKEKLTATHGVKVRRVSTIKLKVNDQTNNYLACLLNDGAVNIFSLPSLYCQYKNSLVASDNQAAKLYTEIVSNGSAYILEQTNLFKHYSLVKSVQSQCAELALPEGARPAVEVVLVEEAAAAVVEEEAKVEAEGEENAEKVEDAEDEAENAGEEAAAAAAPDLQTVEEEAKKMIEEAEESKDSDFQRRIQEELTSDNPVLTETTVTTYRAIESRTILSSDDGEQCAKIITTTRDTTLSLDGDVVTQKTQQKEEFEVTPSEQQEQEPNGEIRVDSVSSGELQETAELESDAQIVRTATLTREEECAPPGDNNEDVLGSQEKLDTDTVTHHITEEGDKKDAEESVAAVAAEEAPEPVFEMNVEQPAADEEEQQAVEESKQEEENEVEAAAEEEAEDENEAENEGVKGECYGGSTGKLYSPMGREENEVEAPVEPDAEDDAAVAASDIVNGDEEDATDVVVNGDDKPETNGDSENHVNGNSIVEAGAGEGDAVNENAPESVPAKAVFSEESSAVSEAVNEVGDE